jgi:hypothetical protein
MSSTVENSPCDDVLDRLEALIDGALAGGDRLAVERHLAGCTSCAGELEHAVASVNALRSLPEVDVPDRVIEKAREALALDKPTAEVDVRARRRRRWLAAAAVIVVGILGTSFVMRRSTPQPDPEALRAAAEVRFALATMGEITERANRIVRARIIDCGPDPRTFSGLARSLEPLRSLQPADAARVAPLEPTHEGSL